MGKTANDIMTKAISYIGTKEVPSGSNKVIFNTDYYGKAVSGSAYPWCCAYVWDIFRMCGASDLFYDGNKTAYCPTVESWGKSKGLTVAKDKGQYGDIVLFDFYGKGVACHIGFIEKKNANGTYDCIEGNTSVTSQDNGGSVMRRNRNQSSIRCIIRPKYAASGTKSSTSTSTKTTTSSKTTTSAYTKTQFIKDVQKACGAKVDGIAGSETLSKTVTLSKKKNTKHASVKPVQKYLNALGYNCGTADGEFGSKTEAAVKAYQKAKGCVVDGEISAKAKTWKKLLGLS